MIIYGIAAYNAWQSKRDDDFDVMNQYRKEHYVDHLPRQMTQVNQGPDDPTDGDYGTPPVMET